MQCPYNHNEMVAMYDELSNIDDGSWEHVKGVALDVSYQN